MVRVIIIIVLAHSLSQIIHAQEGPIITCANCDNLSNKPMPVSGSWYNPDQSGTGYILDIKKGYVSGLYFGYDNDGKPLWLSFQGPLQETDDPEVKWALDSTFTKISGGNAFNQSYQFPVGEETGDQI